MKKIKHKKSEKGVDQLLKFQLKENLQTAEAYYNFGISLHKKQRLDEAIACYQKVLQLNPNFSMAYYNLGIAYQEKQQLDKAITYYQKALRIDPNLAMAYNNLGIAYQEKQRLDEAIACYQKALQLNPNFDMARCNLGNALKDKGQTDEAVTYYQKTIELNPNYADAYNNLGSSLQDKAQLEEAIIYYQKALQLNPRLVMAHWNLSHACLSLGDFNQGWKEYEWRWLLKDFGYRNYPQPLWDGLSLKGRTLFVYREQGVGDEIMFASCLTKIIDRADLCVVECDKRLVPLFARSFPRAKIIEQLSEGDVLSPELLKIDMKVPFGSIPKYIRPNLQSFQQQKAYLIPDAQKVELWRSRFTDLGEGLKVGISWRGGKYLSVRRMRSTVLEQWAELFSIPGVHFINLQYGDCFTELKEAREKLGVAIHDWEDADPLKDLDGFAAQIAALDLIISVDNVTVHMAGALGVPVWVLLPFACDWRWMRDFEDTPWYASVRLFRQYSLGDWNEVFECVSSNLGQCITSGVMPNIDPRYSYKKLLQGKQDEVHQSFTHITLLSSDRKYRCGVITPVGPGHEKLYDECLASIEKAFYKMNGNFLQVIPIKIDDTEGRLGRSRARNIGIRKAADQGVEWIFFLDADDLMTLSAFEYVSPYLASYDAIWGGIWVIEKGDPIPKERPRQLPFLYSIEDVLSCDPFVSLQMGHFVKISVVLSTLFNESLDVGEDFDYYLRVWEKYRCIKIPLPFFYNRRGYHSHGPKSATGHDWRQQVETIIKKRWCKSV